MHFQVPTHTHTHIERERERVATCSMHRYQKYLSLMSSLDQPSNINHKQERWNLAGWLVVLAKEFISLVRNSYSA